MRAPPHASASALAPALAPAPTPPALPPPPLLRLRGPCALLSDLHLNGGARDPHTLRALGAAARGALGAPAAHVLLVGDVFDFHLGYRRTLYAHLLPAYRLLAALVEEGVEVVVFTGNHDPDPCPVLAALGARVLRGPAAVEDPWGRVAWVEHGDALEPRALKRLACRLARAPLVTAAARLLPPALALALAPRLPEPPSGALEEEEEGAAGAGAGAALADPLPDLPAPWLARQWARRAPALEEALARAARPPLAARPLPLWCFGHFHAARAQPLAGAEVELRVLGDWVSRRTLAWWGEGGPRLARWSVARGAFDALSAQAPP